MPAITRMLRGRRGPADLSLLQPVDQAFPIPDADFVSPSFDSESPQPPSRMVVILSTPRSGSTYLCQLLYRAGFCMAHEYFQPYQYLPLLAYRWGCVEDGHVSWPTYALALERHRTSARGVLGVNLHGAHVRHFLEALPSFTAPDVGYVWLRRRDKLRQAVSYAIALQTRKWSSHFARHAEPRYDHRRFRDSLEAIHAQEDLIQAFLHARAPVHGTVDYEDLVDDPSGNLKRLFDVESAHATAKDDRGLRRQADVTNEAYLSRFAGDIIDGRDPSSG
jgi:LPS sulfotransferase NodH